MSDGDNWVDPLKEPAPIAPSQKKRMSGCMLATLIVGGLGLFGMLVCCGGVTWLYLNFVPTISKEPEVVNSLGKQILNAEVLADFAPEGSAVIDNRFLTVRIAKFQHKEGKGDILLGSAKIHFDLKQLKDKIDEERKKAEKEFQESVEVDKSEVHKVMINGQEVPVTIAEAKNKETDKDFHQVTANFEHAGTMTFLIMQIDDEIWDEAAVLKMLQEAKP